jgi:hypothetical protein
MSLGCKVSSATSIRSLEIKNLHVERMQKTNPVHFPLHANERNRDKAVVLLLPVSLDPCEDASPPHLDAIHNGKRDGDDSWKQLRGECYAKQAFQHMVGRLVPSAIRPEEPEDLKYLVSEMLSCGMGETELTDPCNNHVRSDCAEKTDVSIILSVSNLDYETR